MSAQSYDLSRLARCHLLVAGDLMLDEYVWGHVERISPEAPVPVVSVTREDTTLGGAGNVIHNLVALGARVSALGAIGKDAHGRRLIGRLADLGVKAEGVLQMRHRVTTRKTRIIGDHQQVLRIDRESTSRITTRLVNRLLAHAKKMMPTIDAVVISDYGKGLITRALVSGLARTARAHNKPIIADPKGLDFTKYEGVSLITPNTKEAALASGIDIHDEQDLQLAAELLLETVAVDGLLVTRGGDGVAYFERNAPTLFVGAKYRRQVFDLSGAGDTVVAVLSLALAAGYSMQAAITIANAAAGIVVTKVGTATVSRAELAEALSPSHDPARIKKKTIAELRQIAARHKTAGKRVVLTNGCFDLLHAGHIGLFAASKELGDTLIVALDDDQSVRALKGPGRPVIDAGERVKILSAIDSIDYVTVFATKNLPEVIAAVQPDILTKGSNYETEQVLGKEMVERLGGRVALLPVTADISSTDIINTIKKN